MKYLREAIENQLNKFSLRSKMLIIQIFCVIIPLLITDSAIIGIIVNAERQEDIQEMNNIADSVNYTISSACEATLQKMREIYINRDINNFIKEEFESPLDYYNKFLELSKVIENGKTSSILYSDSPGAVNGGHFQQISVIENEDWYKEFIDTGRDVVLIADFMKVNWETRRGLFFVRKMDFYNKKSTSILKLDLDYSDILRRITNAKYSTTVYVCKDDYIIFSNEGHESIYNEYDMVSAELINRAAVVRSINIYGDDWNIYVMPGEKIVMGAIMRNLPMIIFLLFINIFLPFIFTRLINKSVTGRLYDLKDALEKVEGDGLYTLPEISGYDEISDLMQTYNEMAVRLNTLIDKEYKSRLTRQESDIARQRAELLALHSQINPHFLFNALESIRMHSVIKHENETARMIEKLALMQRQNVEWGNDSVTIRDEMRFAEAYLELQKYRFGNKLRYEINMDEDCATVHIPKLSIVTFVENACVHGMENKTSACWIFVRVSRTFGDLVLEIEDTGSGISDEVCMQLNEEINNVDIEMLQTENKHIGILNAALRLKMSRPDVRFEIESESGAGTMVTITIPQESSNRVSEEK